MSSRQRKRPKIAVTRKAETETLVETETPVALHEALMLAARQGDSKEIKRLLHASAPIDGIACDGSPLTNAVRFEQCEAVEELLKAGANPNLVTDMWTPLRRALGDLRADLVSPLLKHGAIVRQADLNDAVHIYRDAGFGERFAMDVIMPMLAASTRGESLTATQSFDQLALGPADSRCRWDYLHQNCNHSYCPVHLAQAREAKEAAKRAE